MKLFISIFCLTFSLFGLTYSQTYVYPSLNAQVETPIAINPTNSNNLIAGAILQLPSLTNAIGCYYSTNAGNSWSAYENFTGPNDTSAGDPVVVFDPDGNAYFIYQVFSEKTFFMRKSTDGGQSWLPSLSSDATSIISVGSNETIDRPSVAISPIRNSNGYFNIYVAFTHYSGSTEYIDMYISEDGGSYFYNRNSVHPSSNLNYAGASVAVGPKGEVFLSWGKELKPRVPVDSISIMRSTDQGINFSNYITISVNQIGAYKYTAKILNQ